MSVLRDSVRTRNRATALAWARGCFEHNLCWSECREAALDSIVEDDLSDWDREQATTSRYWHFTNPTEEAPDA